MNNRFRDIELFEEIDADVLMDYCKGDKEKENALYDYLTNCDGNEPWWIETAEDIIMDFEKSKYFRRCR